VKDKERESVRVKKRDYEKEIVRENVKEREYGRKYWGKVRKRL
jgi:hypothetical protein